MKETLKLHRKYLSELVSLLIEEKNLLIQLDGKGLAKIVKLKSEIVQNIGKVEQDRKERFNETAFKDFVLYNNEGNHLKKQIEKLVGEARDLQEINTMLTKKSIEYNQNFMGIIKKAISKGPSLYSGKGYMRKSSIAVQGTFDQSV